MSVAQLLVVIGVSLALLIATIALMSRAIRRERRSMERRNAEWIAGGSVPEEKPNFYSGPERSGFDGG